MDKKYHVACGLTSIVAGTVKRIDGNETEFKDRNDVTDEAISAVAQYLLQHRIRMKFKYQDKWYALGVEEIIDDD